MNRDDKQIVIKYLEQMYNDCIKERGKIPWYKHGKALGLEELRSSLAVVIGKIEDE